MCAQAEARELLTLIAGLPVTLRPVVEPVAVDGLTVTDAAAVLDITSGAARARSGTTVTAACFKLPNHLTTGCSAMTTRPTTHLDAFEQRLLAELKAAAAARRPTEGAQVSSPTT